MSEDSGTMTQREFSRRFREMLGGDESGLIPQDEFSKRLRELRGSQDAVERSGSVDLVDTYGNIVTWTVRTIRLDGRDTVFLQRMTATGGERRVLPPEVTELIKRQQSSAITTNRRRGAAKAAATRKADGQTPFTKKAAAHA